MRATSGQANQAMHITPRLTRQATQPQFPEFITRQVTTPNSMEIASARGIRYGTGKAFHSGGRDITYLRLAFGYPSLEDIRDGVPLLAECVKEARGVPVQAATA